MDAASERARFRDAVDRLRQSCGYSMEDVSVEFGVTLNMAQRWRSESGRHKPRAGWEAVLAQMAERGAIANRKRADAAKQLADELRSRVTVDMKLHLGSEYESSSCTAVLPFSHV
jgi:transcriptional regulator with XRE-family HTH domain